jgi:hypothetical protein
MDVGKELKVKSDLSMEMKSAQRAKVKSTAAVNAPGFWPRHQKETCYDGSRARMRKGSRSGWEAAALDANVDPSKRTAAALRRTKIRVNIGRRRRMRRQSKEMSGRGIEENDQTGSNSPFNFSMSAPIENCYGSWT